MMKTKRIRVRRCPLCGRNLSLCCINIRSSILFCKDVKCPYPVGYNCTVFKKKVRRNSLVPNNPTFERNSGSASPFASIHEEHFNIESVAHMLIDDITKNCESISDDMDTDYNQQVLNGNLNPFNSYFEQNEFDLGIIKQECDTTYEDIAELNEVYDELSNILASLN